MFVERGGVILQSVLEEPSQRSGLFDKRDWLQCVYGKPRSSVWFGQRRECHGSGVKQRHAITRAVSSPPLRRQHAPPGPSLPELGEQHLHPEIMAPHR